MGESFEHLILNQRLILDNSAEIWDFMPASELNLGVGATQGQHEEVKTGAQIDG